MSGWDQHHDIDDLEHTMRQHQPPPGPTNARLIHTDGTIIPLELRYAGTDQDGYHRWIATARADLEHCDLHVDQVPPRTSIEIEGLQR